MNKKAKSSESECCSCEECKREYCNCKEDCECGEKCDCKEEGKCCGDEGTCDCDDCGCGNECDCKEEDSCCGDCCCEDTTMQMHEISKVVDEYAGNRTIYINEYISCVPGQFAMVWLPGVDEKPFSIMNLDGKSAINVEVKGKWSRAAAHLRKGDKIGMRTPFGNGFMTRDVEKALLIGGGVGTVPLMPVLGALAKKGAQIDFILAARSKGRLLFEKEIKKKSDNLYITTDDGSAGKKGFATDAMLDLVKINKYDMVYVCGPEIMMKKIHEICTAKKIPSQFSLERYMKCGFGVCGECMLDDKILCVDGPILSGRELEKSGEFGKTAYLKSGKRVGLQEFYSWKQK